MTVSENIVEALQDQHLPAFSVMAPFGELPGIADLVVIVQDGTSAQVLRVLRDAHLPVRSLNCTSPGFIHVWFR